MSVNENVGIKVGTDTAAAVANVQKLKSSFDQLARSTTSFAKSSGDGLDDITGAMMKLNGALELAGKAMSFAKGIVEAAKFSAELDNMQARVPVRQLEAMRKATEGAVDKITLMKFSMKALSGELRLTEKGMDNVLRAANTLSDQGLGDTMEIAEKLLDVLRRGSTRGLKEFGIALTDVADKNKNVNATFEKLHELANKEINVDPQLKAIERLQTGWRDFLTEIEAGFGRALRKAAALAAVAGEKVIGGATSKLDQRAIELADEDKALGWFYKNHPLLSREDQDHLKTQTYRAEISDLKRMAQSERSNIFIRNQAADAAFLLADVKAQGAQGYFSGRIPDKEGRGRDTTTGPIGWGATGRQVLYDMTPRIDPYEAERVRGFFGPNQATTGETGEAFLMGGARGSTQGFGITEDQLRSLSDLQSQLGDSSSAIGAAFSTMSSGIAAAVDAAVTGSENVGKAFLRASSQALKAIATEHAVRAIAEGAMALGSLAIGAGASAALHGKAAAMHAAAAAAAGLGAAALGSAAGSAGSSQTAPGGGFASAPQNGGSGGNTTIIVQVGEGFVGRPDELAAEIDSKIRNAQRSGRVRQQSGAVTFKV